MADVQKIRDLLAQADRHKRLANGAEMGRVHIRLGYKPRVERKRTFRVDTTVFTPEETTALYEALGLVKQDHLDRATEYERQAADG